MKKNSPVFGVLFAVAVASIFLAVSIPSKNGIEIQPVTPNSQIVF